MRIRLQVGFVVDFKSHAALAQFVHSFFYAVYGKIQHRESGWLVVGLGVQQSFGAAGKGHNQGAFWTAGKFEPQRFAVKFLRFLNIVHRKAAECLAFVEHRIPSGSFDLLHFDAELVFAVFECGDRLYETSVRLSTPPSHERARREPRLWQARRGLPGGILLTPEGQDVKILL